MNDAAAAQETLQEAQVAAMAIEYGPNDWWTLGDIVKARMGIFEIQLKSGDKGAARRTLQEAQSTAMAISAAETRANALITIVKAQTAANDTASAQQTLRKAQNAANAIAGAADRVVALVGIAEVQGALAEATAVQQTLQEARNTANAIEDADRRANALLEIFEVQATAGHTAAAQQTLQEAKVAARAIENVWDRDLELGDIVDAQALAGDVMAALEMAATDFRFPIHHTSALYGIAKIQSESGDTAGALKTLQNAVEVLQNATAVLGSTLDANDGAEAYAIIATMQANLGDKEAARINIQRAQDWATVAGNRPPREIAVAQAASGDVLAAMRTVKQLEYEAQRIYVLLDIVKGRHKL
jgi:tetratricopeptide (TPR) repeat protein